MRAQSTVDAGSDSIDQLLAGAGALPVGPAGVAVAQARDRRPGREPEQQDERFAKTLKPRGYTFSRQGQYSLRLHFGRHWV